MRNARKGNSTCFRQLQVFSSVAKARSLQAPLKIIHARTNKPCLRADSIFYDPFRNHNKDATLKRIFVCEPTEPVEQENVVHIIRL